MSTGSPVSGGWLTWPHDDGDRCRVAGKVGGSMDDATDDYDHELLDITELPLAELLRRDDSAFSHCLRRIAAETEASTLTVVSGFQSAV
jgi:FXSXX-COOH protein